MAPSLVVVVEQLVGPLPRIAAPSLAAADARTLALGMRVLAPTVRQIGNRAVPGVAVRRRVPGGRRPCRARALIAGLAGRRLGRFAAVAPVAGARRSGSRRRLRPALA